MEYLTKSGERISLRKIEARDADLMMEWMRDRAVNSFFSIDFEHMAKENVLEFINNSFDKVNQHWAFVNEQDEYLGTISLKNIGILGNSAEYSIATRSVAHGTGAAYQATRLLFKYAFEDLKLDEIYLNVLEYNDHAIEFYKRLGFVPDLSKERTPVLVHGKTKFVEWYTLPIDNYHDW